MQTMTRKEIENIVKTFFIDELEVEESKLTDNAKLKDDLRIDSLEIVDVAAMLDQHFGIKVKPDNMRALTTLGDLYAFIEKNQQDK